MNNIYLILLMLNTILFSVFELKSQTVQFQQNVFKLNGQSFFPIGWYECNTTTQLTEAKNAGANTVLVLWDFFISNNGGNYSPNGYLTPLITYLNHANSIGIKVIVQLPYKIQFSDVTNPNNAITNDSYVNTIVDGVKNKPALLGWYLADEPELDNYWNTEPYARLQSWYQKIKIKDLNHPIFVCVSNGYWLENQTVLGIQPNPNNPFVMQKFFDVLMEDHYTLYEGDPIPKLAEFDEYLLSLYHCFENYNLNELPVYSTMLVTQGFGGDDGFRDPTPQEIKYQSLSSLFYAQNHGYSNPTSVNAGGILFWRYGAAESTLRTSISNFIKYFINNSLNNVLSSDRANNFVTDNIAQIETFTRIYYDTLYLFAINRSDTGPLSVQFKMHISSYTNCWELTVPNGYVIKTMTNLSGGYKGLNDTFQKRTAKVYKITGIPLLPKTIHNQDQIEIVPAEFSLKQNFPNPFNPITTISFSIPQSQNVELKVFDILGNEITILLNEYKQAGEHKVEFDGGDISSGIYFYQLKAGDFIQTKRLVLLR